MHFDLLRENWDREVRGIRIFADVDVKHSVALASRPIVDEVEDTIHRGLADALIVSGWGTGKPTDPKKAKAVKAAVGETPVFIGSGVSAKTVAGLLNHADGFIVGTAFKRDGLAKNPVDSRRVKEFMARFR